MAGERIELPIEEICHVKQGRYLAPGEMSALQTSDSPIPVYGANGILGFTDKVMYQEPVSLVTCRGNGCGLIQRTTGKAWISNNAMACPPKGKNDSRFLYYLLLSSDFQDVTTGSAQPQITAGHLNRKKLLLATDPAEQKAMAAVLGALDDKIELNRRMNGTLEAVARALFQSWFVDFDPVRAKAEGRSPAGLDEPTAALFPTKFQDSELGPIPQGWNVGTVNDLTEFSRTSLTPANFPDEAFDHYSLPAFDEGRTPKTELGVEIKSNKLTVPVDAVLLSKLNPHIPRIWAPSINGDRRAICSTEFLVALPTPVASREFLFCLFTSDAFSRTYATLVTGTTGSHQRIKAESVLTISTVIPPTALVERFTTATKPMFERVNRNIDQSRTLAILRDTLLPRLFSGELPL